MAVDKSWTSGEPFLRAETITLNTTYSPPMRAISVDASGNVTLKLKGDPSTIQIYMLVGVIYNLLVEKVTVSTPTVTGYW